MNKTWSHILTIERKYQSYYKVKKQISKHSKKQLKEKDQKLLTKRLQRRRKKEQIRKIIKMGKRVNYKMKKLK